MTNNFIKTTPKGGPKLFMSYSWSSQEHEAWVLQLATELRESGIDVVLDKWDLKEGHDAHAFMEKMVTDPEIRKVILICDKAYAEKTDDRTGGVGAEAQIISGTIYEKQAQDKFVAVLKERGKDGKPYLPTYYRSRIYIDLSDTSTYLENFERLLRWAYDQPLYRRPGLGQKPTFLSNENELSVSLATSSRQRRALDALRNNRQFALVATREYFDQLSQEVEKLRINGRADPFDDAVVASIEGFLPYRDEAIEIFIAIAANADTPDSRTVVHSFFEKLIPYMYRPSTVSSFRDWDWDNFKFIIHELFLFAIAALIRYERFESAASLMQNRYYDTGRFGDEGDVMASFVIFRQHTESLRHRNKRLALNRLSLRADFLQKRCYGVGIEFRQLMQADFILFIRSRMGLEGEGRFWFPETLVHRHSGPFEVFARSRSKTYFARVKVLFGIEQKAELGSLLASFTTSPQAFPRWEYESLDAAYLLGFEKLATEP